MSRPFGIVATSVCATLLAVCVVSPAAAQPAGPQGDTYATIGSLPDWSGIWARPWAEFEAENAGRRDPSAAPKLTDEGMRARAAFQKTRAALASSGIATAPQAGTCGAARPHDVPRVMRLPFGIEFLFTPGRVTMLLELGSTIRRVYTDGRQHGTNSELTYVGESIGHWEGDTLVVDTRAIKEGGFLAAGIPSSEQMRVIERIRRIEPARLQIETVIEDPIILREPWRSVMTYERSTLGWIESECDNDRDGRDQEPDLTPPK